MIRCAISPPQRIWFKGEVGGISTEWYGADPSTILSDNGFSVDVSIFVFPHFFQLKSDVDCDHKHSFLT